MKMDTFPLVTVHPEIHDEFCLSRYCFFSGHGIVPEQSFLVNPNLA